MIRNAGQGDLDQMLLMARDFMDYVGLPFEAPIAHAEFAAHLSDENALALVLVLDGAVCGMLCAVQCRLPLSSQMVAMERIFWIEPSNRGRWAVKMIAAYEEWAKGQGCFATNIVSFGPKAADRLYLRRKYEPAERHFLKVN